uniref:PSP proline-rich domain-containing protein n=1 Tax=Plectus sambesii TaxID=2011161 RepID=A0A914VG94_9BILA
MLQAEHVGPAKDSISLNSVLTTDSTIASLKEGDGRPKRRAIECFNCGGPHIIGKCPEPRDHARIARAMRQQRMNRTPDVGRYHDAGDAELASRFRAGIVSPDLADALGLRRNELPEWIYRMRKLGFIKGYPPGYLKQAIVSEREAVNDILQFHCDQPDGDLHSTDELAPRVSRIEPNKVIYYFGFNKAARDNIRDREASWYSVPSFEAFVDIHQEELNRQQERAERAARHKRHHQGDDQPQSSPSKKLKREPTVVDMDVSSDDEPTTSGGLLPPPPLPPTEYDALTEEELEQLLAKKRLEMANMEEIGSPEPEEDDRDEAANDAPTLIPTDDGDRAITPPSVERRFVRHASSRSLDVMVGTPLGAPPSSHLKPSLDDFSKGIVPFSVNEEAPDAHKGFFKRIMAKLKGVANKKLKSPKTHGDADPQGAVRLDKRKGASRQRKKKN